MTTYSGMATYSGPVDKAQRAYIRDAMGWYRAERYRITKAGEVHFYGQMPNSQTTGWWLFAQSTEEANQIIGRAWLEVAGISASA